MNSHSSRRLLLLVGLSCLPWLLLGGGLAWGQAPVEPPPPPEPSGGAQIVRPLWTEAAITVGMIGLALFAVCRNSNRT